MGFEAHLIRARKICINVVLLKNLMNFYFKIKFCNNHAAFFGKFSREKRQNNVGGCQKHGIQSLYADAEGQISRKI